MFYSGLWLLNVENILYIYFLTDLKKQDISE